MTASLPAERVSRRVANLDEDQEPADLLWIPCANAPADRRTLDVPAELRPLIAALAEAKAGHLIAATLGHEGERTTIHAYAAPHEGRCARRGLVVLNDGVQAPEKKAQ